MAPYRTEEHKRILRKVNCREYQRRYRSKVGPKKAGALKKIFKKDRPEYTAGYVDLRKSTFYQAQFTRIKATAGNVGRIKAKSDLVPIQRVQEITGKSRKALISMGPVFLFSDGEYLVLNWRIKRLLESALK